MSWMGAIYVDALELQRIVVEKKDMDPGELAVELEETHGWICPTVAGLTRTLIGEVMSRNEFTAEDKEQMERVIALLGTGT